jgi:hypothetical protein
VSIHISETICNRRHDYQIYTDGSRTQRDNGEEIVGCALVIYSNDVEVFTSTDWLQCALSFKPKSMPSNKRLNGV